MRVHLGSDHAGLELKEHLLSHLAEKGHEVVDHGPFIYDAVDDYPPFCLRAAEGVIADREDSVQSFGIVIGGSGNGEQIAANKVKGIRAALVWSEETAVLAREHNDANVISVGGRMHTPRGADPASSTSSSARPTATRTVTTVASARSPTTRRPATCRRFPSPPCGPTPDRGPACLRGTRSTVSHAA